jgi:hypothetical protein
VICRPASHRAAPLRFAAPRLAHASPRNATTSWRATHKMPWDAYPQFEHKAYRVRNDNMLKRLRRWPAALGEAGGGGYRDEWRNSDSRRVQ